MRSSHLIFHTVPWDHPVAHALRLAQHRELERITPPDSRYDAGADPSPTDDPRYVIAQQRTTLDAIGGGGFRRIDPTTAELKRLYLMPMSRGSGAAAELLTAVEDAAREAGFTRLVTEAAVFQDAGRRLYLSAGFTEAPAFEPYVGAVESVCYAKDLPTVDR